MTLLGISILNLVLWAIFGLVVGFIVHLIDPGDVKGGILGTAILGILGALVGGVLAALIIGHAIIGFSIQGFVTAVIGGLILAFLSRLLFRDREHIRTTTTQLR